LLIIVAIIAFVRKGTDQQLNKDMLQQPKSVKPIRRVEPEPELSQAMPSPAEEPNLQAAEMIKNAMSLLEASPAKIIEARDILNETLIMPMAQQQRDFVKQKLTELAAKWLFSRRIYPQDSLCESYRVKSGEMLSEIGKRCEVPYQILMEINTIRQPQALRAGEPIKIINGPFHARIYRSTFTMDVYLQKMFVQSFAVGLGKKGRETPTGLWKVKKNGKLISPTWTDPDTGKTYEAEDADYPLGSRWIALEGLKGDALGRSGIAFHGIKDKDSNTIGTTGSRGCIRLYNGDIIFVYNLLVPEYSRVEVLD
jgi:lipoprotein-anchoring transpeptidase ErfK/SrfK